MKIKSKRKNHRPSLHLIEGKLIYKNDKFLLKHPSHPTAINIYAENCANALPFDDVLISYTTQKNGKIKGQVQKIIKRNLAVYIGRLFYLNQKLFCKPLAFPNYTVFNINNHSSEKFEEGQFVKIKFLEWETHHKYPSATIIEKLHHTHSLEIKSLNLLEFQQVQQQFSPEVLNQAQQALQLQHPDHVKQRTDFRAELCLTIDPEDAQDFDDALSLKILPNAEVEVGVHIADVSHFIPIGSPIFETAAQRGCSYYLPHRVVPMLPEILANDLCSLKPNEDRLTLSIVFVFDAQFKIKSYSLSKGIIHSKKRFSYEQVQHIIDQKKGEFSEQILHLHKIAQCLRQNRLAAGAIDFRSTELKFKLDQQLLPQELYLKSSQPAHQLIEEFMLLANEYVAKHLSEKFSVSKHPSSIPFRVHDLPDTEKIKIIAFYARKFKQKFNSNTPLEIAHSFNKLIQHSQGQPWLSVIEQLGIRSMAKAQYSSKNIGHYGLGLSHYCHFTSPIRRFPDLIIHHLLSNLLLSQNKNIDFKTSINEYCQLSNDAERKASTIERDLNAYLQVLFMKPFIGEVFKGVICGVAAHGCWVKIIKYNIEGYFSLDTMHPKKPFIFNAEQVCLISKDKKTSFYLGDEVMVKLITVNEDKNTIDVKLVIKNE